jgi:hypothetical protein
MLRVKQALVEGLEAGPALHTRTQRTSSVVRSAKEPKEGRGPTMFTLSLRTSRWRAKRLPESEGRPPAAAVQALAPTSATDRSTPTTLCTSGPPTIWIGLNSQVTPSHWLHLSGLNTDHEGGAKRAAERRQCVVLDTGQVRRGKNAHEGNGASGHEDESDSESDSKDLPASSLPQQMLVSSPAGLHWVKIHAPHPGHTAATAATLHVLRRHRTAITASNPAS